MLLIIEFDGIRICLSFILATEVIAKAIFLIFKPDMCTKLFPFSIPPDYSSFVSVEYIHYFLIQIRILVSVKLKNQKIISKCENSIR